MPNDAIVGELEAALAAIGPLPICPGWMYSSIRHCQRNMDFDVDEGFHEPDRQCGGSVAKIVNALPQLLAALKAREEALRPFAEALDLDRLADCDEVVLEVFDPAGNGSIAATLKGSSFRTARQALGDPVS